MLKSLVCLICSILLFSCSMGENHQDNRKRIIAEWGECDNPFEPISQRKYKECLAKERAQGESLFDFTDDLGGLINKGDSNVVYQSSVNPYLWQASLEVTKKYPLKIADNQGGYIETEWIYDPNNNKQRCLIKLQILSRELITTGVSSNFICESKVNENWIVDEKEYSEEAKQITLKILDLAGNLSNTQL